MDPNKSPNGARARLRNPLLPKRPERLDRLVTAGADETESHIIEGVVDTLLNGGVAALATDTVYGVGVDATNPTAVEQLYRIKQRERSLAIPLLIGDLRMLRHLTPFRDDETLAFLNLFWPGPLTAVLPRYPGSFLALSQTETIGIRMPDHPVLLSILRALGRPLAMTSANLSGQAAAVSAAEVLDIFGETVDVILDSGPSTCPTPSTVLDLSSRPFRILRQGPVTAAQMQAVLGEGAIAEG